MVFCMTLRHNPKSIILGELPLEDVLSRSMSQGFNARSWIHEGDKFSISRMRVFAIHGCRCTMCGLEGTKVIMSKDNGGGLHIDLYAETKRGYTLMNRDHILPASKKGKDSVWNMRPTCAPCNTKRGNHYTKKDKALFRRRQTVKGIATKVLRNRFINKWNRKILRFLSWISS